MIQRLIRVQLAVILVVGAVMIALGLFSRFLGPPPQPSSKPSVSMKSMKITSAAFHTNTTIPSKYTCDGENISPPLTVSGVPATAKDLVLIVDDPDAPNGTWVHWTVWNMDPTTNEIPEGRVPADSTQGTTSSGRFGYGGPCPPSGTHRYFFKLYALDEVLKLKPSVKAQEIMDAINGHVIDSAELIGLYQRAG